MQTYLPDSANPFRHRWIKPAVEEARLSGRKLYLVGGYVRDALLNPSQAVVPKDFDFSVCHGSAVGFARDFAERHSGHFVLLDSVLDTARVVTTDGVILDFAGCMGSDFREDIRRRDFTINALAWDPDQPDTIIDYVGGLQDLAGPIIRVVSEQSLSDDPLRVLRAYRFSAALKAPIDPVTRTLLPHYAAGLSIVAGERISYEWFSIMENDGAGALVKDMAEAGVLEAVFPELRRQKEVTANAYHHLGLFDHSVETVAQCEDFLKEAPEWTLSSLQGQLSFAVTRLAATKTACLLHDIGKPDTWVITGDRHTFIGHDKLGAQMNEALARRLKWPRPVERFITKLIRWHLRPGQLFHQGVPTDKAVHRFYRTIGQEVPELIALAFADLGATRGPGLEESRRMLENGFRELLEGYRVFIDSQRKMPRLMNGTEIMRLLGINPGPTVGQLLEELEEAQGLKQVMDREQAERFVQERYQEKYSG